MSRRAIAGAALLVLAAAIPPVVAGTRWETYVQHVVIQVMLMGLYAMAWDFLNGYVGLFSFGHAAFFGAGAYTAGILIVRGGVTFAPLVLGAALLVAVVIGLVVGALAARVGTVAVFLVTFAAAEVLYLVILSDPRGLTHGDNGLPGVMPAPLLGFDFSHRRSFYYLILAVVILSYAALTAITRTPFGRVLMGIRENEVRVRFAGYRIEQYKTVAFGISAFFAGLAGALTAINERIAAPEAAGWFVSGEAVLYATLGGTGTLLGPILGAGIIILAREVLSEFFHSWLIFVGLTYIFLVFFLPQGLYPLLFRPASR
jgi:branched-chain amino acid transport system permease protein